MSLTLEIFKGKLIGHQLGSTFSDRRKNQELLWLMDITKGDIIEWQELKTKEAETVLVHSYKTQE